MAILDWIWSRDSSSSNATCYHIEGFLTCAFLHAATDLAKKIQESEPGVSVSMKGHEKEQWPEKLENLRARIPDAKSHSTSPFVYEGCGVRDFRFVGGYNEFFELARRRHDKKVNTGR